MAPVSDPAYVFQSMLPAGYSGILDNDGYGNCYNLCECARNDRICQRDLQVMMCGNTVKRSACAEHMR